MQTAGVTEQIEEVRRRAVTLLGELDTRGEEFGLPGPPEALRLYHRELQDNEYKVLVVGEAKRGKSAFVNALIGQDILPTDVDVATSQVFKIAPSEQEAYRLRFEDGSVREISREDLPLYGAQMMADAASTPTPDHIVRWIEVDAPIRFLPRGVSVLDTPGLGALYAGHAQITHRFVPEADAVIFVLESGQPVVDEDLKFIEEILGVTRNIFFIQTKIDLFDKQDWQAIQRRNQEILAQKFEDQLIDTRIWPVSSTNLRKAASWDGKTAEALLMVSRHSDLEAALMNFLARVAGWGQAAEAMLAAAQYHSTGLKVLSGRLAGVGEGSNQQRSELRQAAVRRKQRFDAEWGLNGRELRALDAQIQESIFVGKQSFARYIEPDGYIERTMREEIDKIETLEQANTFAKQMPDEVVAAAIKRWTEVGVAVQDRCAELLRPLAEAAENVSVPVEQDLQALVVPDNLDEEFKHDYLQMYRGVIGAGTMLSGVGTVAFTLFPDMLVSSLAPPAALVAVPVLLMLAYRAIKDAGQEEIKSTRDQLNATLGKLVQGVHRHFTEVDLTGGRLSLVDEYFKTLERTMNEHIGDLVRQRSGEANAEMARLTEAARLDDQQRGARSRRLRSQLDEWEMIGKKIKDTMIGIKALKEAGAAPAPGRATAGEGLGS
jgi:GTPase SAR1 family protein